MITSGTKLNYRMFLLFLFFFSFFLCVSYQAALCVCVRKRGISEIDKGMRRGEERDRESICVCVCV